MRKRTGVVLVLVAGGALSGCGTVEEVVVPSAPRAAAQVEPVSEAGAVLKLNDQPLSQVVVIDSLTLDKPGYVVIHKDENGKPGAVLGQSQLISPGTFNSFSIRFDASQAGERVFPMLHYDDGNGVYEFPGPDGPVVVDGEVLAGAVNWQ